VEAALGVFENVAIDLLFAFPGQTEEHWRKDLTLALSTLAIPHLSCYALVSIAEGSAFANPQIDLAMSFEAMAFAESIGLKHYASCASSGFDVARCNSECRYEVQHWSAPQTEFLGLGPGAFGFIDNHVTANQISLSTYYESLMSDNSPLVSATPVDPVERRHRYFALGIKVLKVPFGPYRNIFGEDPRDRFKEQFSSLESNGLVQLQDNELSLTPIGRLCVDQCTEAFFSEAERTIAHPEEPELRAFGRTSPQNHG
jgi:oxygen-independent coproporphyrinogen-3 oxidase